MLGLPRRRDAQIEGGAQRHGHGRCLLIRSSARPEQLVEQVAEPCLEHVHLGVGDRDMLGPVVGDGPRREVVLGRPAEETAKARLEQVYEARSDAGSRMLAGRVETFRQNRSRSFAERNGRFYATARSVAWDKNTGTRRFPAALAWRRQALGGLERTRALDPLALLGAVHRLPQIAAPLHVEPEVRAVAEHARQDESRRCRHVPAVVAQLVDVLALHAHRLGQRGLGQARAAA